MQQVKGRRKRPAVGGWAVRSWDWGHSPVVRVFAMKAQGPEFRALEAHLKCRVTMAALLQLQSQKAEKAGQRA